MGAITKNMVERIYVEGVRLYNGEIGRQEAKEIVNKATSMDMGSCNDYYTVLGALLDGVEYHRTINAFATEYFLESIERDFGAERRKRAANAVKYS